MRSSVMKFMKVTCRKALSFLLPGLLLTCRGRAFLERVSPFLKTLTLMTDARGL